MLSNVSHLNLVNTRRRDADKLVLLRCKCYSLKMLFMSKIYFKCGEKQTSDDGIAGTNEKYKELRFS